MFVVLVLAFGLIAIGAATAVYFEVRSAYCGIALSNGVEVMVSPELHRAIMERYRSEGEAEAEAELELEPEPLRRWDRAVLDVLRLERPNEWRFLVRSLGPQAAVGESLGARRQRQTV
jgi:hypothetical protein